MEQPQTDPFSRQDLATLRYSYRLRQDALAARNRLGLQLQSIARRIKISELLVNGEEVKYDSLGRPQVKVPLKEALEYAAILPLAEAYDAVDRVHKDREKNLVKCAKALPEYALISDMRGVGDLSFAAIIAELGDLSSYATEGRIWKRMGLAVIDGERQRRVAGDADKAIRHGYSPRRRAIMYNLIDSAVKVGGQYAEIVKARKIIEVDRFIEQGGVVYGTSTDKKVQKKMTTAGKAKKHDGPKRTLGHCVMRAERYAAKICLRHLYRKWCRFQKEEARITAAQKAA